MQRKNFNNLFKKAIDQYIQDAIQVFQIWHNLYSELTSMWTFKILHYVIVSCFRQYHRTVSIKLRRLPYCIFKWNSKFSTTQKYICMVQWIEIHSGRFVLIDLLIIYNNNHIKGYLSLILCLKTTRICTRN